MSKNKKQWLWIGAVFLVIIANLMFGFYRLEKKAAVDEPLWTFGRINKFWNNTLDGEWQKTMISDKPGITVALVSGIGLALENPLKEKSVFWNNKIANPQRPAKLERVNFVFRSPLLIFSALSLILFFILVHKLTNNLVALFSIIFIGCSPLILGMTTFVNPDSILWIFSSLAILSFLIYLKNESRKYLYFAGILVGFSILTKYVANILYIFLPLLVFLDLGFSQEKKEITPKALKGKLKDIFVLGLISLLVMAIFLPAIWKDPRILIKMTIFSQAFQKIWIYFVAGVFIFVFDILILRSKISIFIIRIISKTKKILPRIIGGFFGLFSLAVIANVYLGMKFIDFESLLASPKTAYHSFDILEMLIACFYPLIFGIGPLVLFFLFWGVGKIILGKIKDQFLILSLILFIFAYYLASVFSKVEATVRYQVMVLPLVLIIASWGLVEFLSWIKNRKVFWLISLMVVLFSLVSLWQIKPFYFSYASEVLPEKYSINPKDMGDGSYEVAQYLNALPEAEKLTVWSDKDGVCSFFVGSCYNVRDPENFEDFDYFVVSSGRKTRTSRLISQRMEKGKNYRYRIDKFYEAENADWKLEVGGRKNNYLKVFSFNKLQK